MIIAAILIGIILIFFIVLALYISSRNDDGEFDMGVILGVIITTLLFLVLCILDDTNNPHPTAIPTAMDVYQGKTTLEYKVVDGVKVDSVVIFKTMQQD